MYSALQPDYSSIKLGEGSIFVHTELIQVEGRTPQQAAQEYLLTVAEEAKLFQENDHVMSTWDSLQENERNKKMQKLAF